MFSYFKLYHSREKNAINLPSFYKFFGGVSRELFLTVCEVCDMIKDTIYTAELGRIRGVFCEGQVKDRHILHNRSACGAGHGN